MNATINGQYAGLRLGAAALGLLVFSLNAPAVEIHWTGTGTNASWNNPANWNPSQVPTNLDAVFIDLPGSYSVTVDAPAQAASVIVGSGVNSPTLRLTDPNELWVFGDVTIQTNASMWLDGGDFTLQGGPPPYNALTNNGHLQWDAGWIGGGPTYNTPGGVITVGGTGAKGIYSDVYSTGTIRCESGSPFVVEGRLNNMAACVLRTNLNLQGWGAFINTGSIVAPAEIGTVTFAPACSFTNDGGAFVAETNSTLQLAPAAYSKPVSLNAGTIFAGPGLNRIHNPGWYPLRWDGITFFNHTLEMNGGYVEGHPILHGPGHFRLISGSLEGGVTVRSSVQVDMMGGGLGNALVNAGAVLTILDGGSGMGFFGRCTNNGTLRWRRTEQISDVGGAWLNNNLFLLETNCDWTSWVNGQFQNPGVIEVPPHLGELAFTSPPHFTNSGVIRVGTNSTLVIESQSDDFVLENGSVLGGEGSIRFDGHYSMLWKGVISNSCQVEYNQDGWMLGSPVLTGSGLFRWSRGGLGPLGFDTDYEVEVVAGEYLGIFGAVTNNGTIRWGAGQLVYSDPEPGSILNNHRFILLTNANLSFGVEFENSVTGVLLVSDGDSVVEALTNAGTILIERGSLSVDGAFVSTPTATTRFVLSGDQAGTGFGQLNATQGVALGALGVTLTNGFVPDQGDAFALMTSDSLSGSFSPESLPGLPAPLGWQTSYTPTALTLIVTSPLALTLPTLLSDGTVELMVTGTPGRTNVLRASTNLVDWVPLFTNTLNGGTSTFIDSNAVLYPHRFYLAE